MNNIYIFLTNTLGGYSGGPSYVRNKKIWLESCGWIVHAYDSTGLSNALIEYSELKEYENNRIEELFYHPSWIIKGIRERVINKIVSNYSQLYDKIVIESNTLILAEWGELISERLNAKHLIYILGENVKIKNLNEFKFLYHKYLNNEVFSISSKAFQSLWGDYVKIKNAENRYWDAMSMTTPQDIEAIYLNIIDNSNITITHFGRFKDYVSNVIEEVCIFANNNKDKTINFILFGIKSLPLFLKQSLDVIDNINLYLFESVFPIPLKLFKVSDVVIATAGCAVISANTGVKTISYNVETNLPLGIMGYTTNQISFCDENHREEQVLHDILDDILIKKIYEYSAPIKISSFNKGYEYHVSFINNKKDYFKDVLKIDYYNSLKQLLSKLLCKIGMVHIASLLRYQRNK